MKDIVNKIPKEDTMSEDIVVVKNKYSWYIISLSIAGLFAGIFIFVKLIQKKLQNPVLSGLLLSAGAFQRGG